jgi:hypothetical protein
LDQHTPKDGLIMSDALIPSPGSAALEPDQIGAVTAVAYIERHQNRTRIRQRYQQAAQAVETTLTAQPITLRQNVR